MDFPDVFTPTNFGITILLYVLLFGDQGSKRSFRKYFLYGSVCAYLILYHLINYKFDWHRELCVSVLNTAGFSGLMLLYMFMEKAELKLKDILKDDDASTSVQKV